MAGTFERSLQFCSGSLNIEEDSQQPEESGTSLEGKGIEAFVPAVQSYPCAGAFVAGDSQTTEVGGHVETAEVMNSLWDDSLQPESQAASVVSTSRYLTTTPEILSASLRIQMALLKEMKSLNSKISNLGPISASPKRKRSRSRSPTRGGI